MDVRLLALVASFGPALLWLWFFYSRDRYEREPRLLIAKLFLWGLLSGAWAAGLNDLLRGLLGPSIDRAGESGAISLAIGLLGVMVFLAALNEETMKYLVATNSTRNDPNFNERVDGIIYLSSAALGFAGGENFVYIVQAFVGALQADSPGGVPSPAATSQALVAAFAVTAPLRALLSTIGHVAWSGIVGYTLALRVVEKRPPWVVTAGVLLAAGLHTAFNFPQFLQRGLDPGAGLFSRFFLAAVGVWAVSVMIYAVLLRRSLAASPFRTRQIAPGARTEPGSAP
jgi:RsiW-degrading membrane proteinase PrsW (M82 family)